MGASSSKAKRSKERTIESENILTSNGPGKNVITNGIMAVGKKGANLTRKAVLATRNGALAAGRAVGEGFQFFRNRERAAPGGFFGGVKTNRTHKTWGNFFRGRGGRRSSRRRSRR